MPRVVAVIHADLQGRRMEALLRSAFPDVVFDVAHNWGGMVMGFGERYPRALLVDVRFVEDGGPAQVRSVRQLAPWLPVIGLGEGSGVEAKGMFELSKAGVTAIVAPAEFEESEPLRAALSGEGRLAGQVLEALRVRYAPQPLPAGMVAVLEIALERRTGGLPVERLVARLEPSRSSIERLLQRSGAPPPGRILRWCRVLWAVHDLTAEPPATAESTAYELGFAGPSALGNLLVRCLGCRARGARAMGLEGAIDRFVKEFMARRGPRGAAGGRT